jgi:25S rRNA (cytosine2278-C5)-methyltransferase
MDYLLPQGMTAMLFHRTRVDISVLENVESDARDSEARLEKLSAFQLKMITHALKCKTAVTSTCAKLIGLSVPSLQRLVYSTCSIHAAENELVVQRALESEEATQGKFVLASRLSVVPTWNRRGLDLGKNTGLQG